MAATTGSAADPTIAAGKPRSHLIADALLGATLGAVGWIVALLFRWGWNWPISIGVGVVGAVLVRPIHRCLIGWDRATPIIPASGVTVASPRNHVICLDGTWNSPMETPTNVLRLFEALREDSEQIKRYYGGVGTRDLSKARSSWVRERLGRALVGGASGIGHYGALPILLRAYFDFLKTYRPGDRIFIFGFSRGATTARALANYICKTHGLPDSATVEYLKSHVQADAVLRLKNSSPPRYLPPVELLGLWDTVVSMPDRKDFEPTEFDISIPPLVKDVCHLVAIHEGRTGFFDVALIDQDERVEEVWFPGWHSNVGGGAENDTLSKIARRYMMSRAAGMGLRFVEVPDADHCKLTPENVKDALWNPPRGWRPAAGGHRVIRVKGGKTGAVPRIHESAYTFKQLYPQGYDPPPLPDPAQVEIVRGFGT